MYRLSSCRVSFGSNSGPPHSLSPVDSNISTVSSGFLTSSNESPFSHSFIAYVTAIDPVQSPCLIGYSRIRLPAVLGHL